MLMNKKWLYFIFVGAMLSFTSPEKKTIRIYIAGDSTASVKDPRAFPETGWGMPFVHFWDSSVIIENRAKNGRSTKTFISEGLWASIENELREGDFVFIQFGHNDESKEKTERYTTPEQYKKNLSRFISDSRSRGAIPVLMTPVSRRRFDRQGKALKTHEHYSPLVRETAEEESVLLIDLDELSRNLYQQMGMENSSLLFLQLKPGEHPNYPQGKTDNTHFNELGARLIAQLILKEIRSLAPELAARISVPRQK